MSRSVTGCSAVLAFWRVPSRRHGRWAAGIAVAWLALWQRPSMTAGAPVLDARQLVRTQRRWLQQHAGTVLAHPHDWAAFPWIGTS